MAARTGKEFLDGLRDDREIWLAGRRVEDVTAEPSLRRAAESVAALYDLQHEAPDVMLAADPDTGETVGVTHLVPRSRADLLRRHAAIERLAGETMGLMGRSPDYLNVTLAGFAGRSDTFAGRDGGNAEGAANLLAFHRQAMRHDWSITHAIVNPTIDRGVAETAQGDGEVVVHKVGETAGGIVVRGARALATLAPFADEMFVYPGYPLPADAHPYALCFSVPMATPGLKLLCRDSYSSDAPAYDRPFSSRFDEQDAVVIFDDVEVPRERVFIDADADIYNSVMARSGWTANIMQQTTIRALTKLRFAWELATRMAQVVGNESPGANEQLGEIWTYVELTRAALVAAEAGAYEHGQGYWVCDERPFAALRPTLPKWFPRVNEIIKLLGGHSLLATATRAELDNPELRPFIDRYYPGAGGVTAEERIAVFRTAWDFVGTSLGGRNELYERFYLGSSSRFLQLSQVMAAKSADFALVNAVLARST